MSAITGMGSVQKQVNELRALAPLIEPASKYRTPWKDMQSRIKALQKEHSANGNYQNCMKGALDCLKVISRDLNAHITMKAIFDAAFSELERSAIGRDNNVAIVVALKDGRFDAAKKLIVTNDIHPDSIMVMIDFLPHMKQAVTTLGFACWVCDIDMIEWTLQQPGIDINYGNEFCDPNVMPPLFAAACSNAPLDRKLAVMKRLLDAGANVLVRSSSFRWLDCSNFVEMQPEVWQLLLESIPNDKYKETYEKTAVGEKSLLTSLMHTCLSLNYRLTLQGNSQRTHGSYIVKSMNAFQEVAKIMVFHGVTIPSGPYDELSKQQWQGIESFQLRPLPDALILRQQVEKAFAAHQKTAAELRVDVSRECFRKTFGRECTWWNAPAPSAATAATAAAAAAAAPGSAPVAAIPGSAP